MKIYTPEQYAAKLKVQATAGPTVTVDGRKFKACIHMITAVERQVIDGKASVVLYVRQDNGEEFGVMMNRQMADDLTGMLGPHPLVEEFFNLN